MVNGLNLDMEFTLFVTCQQRLVFLSDCQFGRIKDKLINPPFRFFCCVRAFKIMTANNEKIAKI